MRTRCLERRARWPWPRAPVPAACPPRPPGTAPSGPCRPGGSTAASASRNRIALLAAHPPQVLGQLPLDPLLGLGVDLVHQRDQQVDQRVGDLGRRWSSTARPAASAAPAAAPRAGPTGTTWPPAPARPRPASLRTVGEQARRQAERPHRRELVDLPQQRLKAHLARVGLQLGQQPGTGRWPASSVTSASRREHCSPRRANGPLAERAARTALVRCR